MRRPWCVLLGLILTTCIAVTTGDAQTAKFPDKPVRILVGFSAGGGTDVVARILALKMSESLGQTVVVENRAGASGMIAAEATAKSAPDGYTLMMGSQTTFAVAPTLYRRTSLDPARDFAGVAMGGISPLVLVVHPSVQAQSVKDILAMATGEAGRDSLRLGRARHHTAHDRRAVLFGRRHQAGACGLSWRSAGHQRSHWRADSTHVREPLRRHRQYQGGPVARAGRHQRTAGNRGSGDPDGGGGRTAGLRSRDLVRSRCAGRHAARRACADQCRGEARARACRTSSSVSPISA